MKNKAQFYAGESCLNDSLWLAMKHTRMDTKTKGAAMQLRARRWLGKDARCRIHRHAVIDQLQPQAGRAL